MLPISPKFFEEVFGKRTKYCFISMKLDRIESLIRRQNKKNQISTFTDWKDTNIFWGAEGLEWGYNLETAVAVLKGNITLQGNNDLWTQYDKHGRRWIDAGELRDNLNGMDKIGRILIKISDEIAVEFQKKYQYIPVKKRPDEKYINEYITHYFDISYKILKKYKDELIKGVDKFALGSYNEVLCYNYKIEKIIISGADEDYFTKNQKKLLNKIDIKYVDYDEKIEKELEKYKKLNYK